MKLNEILDSTFKYTLHPSEQYGDYEGYFEDEDGEIISVNFEYWSGPKLYIVSFKRKGSWATLNDSPKDKNHAIKILSTVVAMIKDFTKLVNDGSRPAKFLAYSVDKEEKSRSKSYASMLKRLSKTVGYHEVHDASKVDDDVLPQWWATKTKLTTSHDYVLLAKDS